MSVPVRLAAFALLLAVGFGAAYGVGVAVGPVDGVGSTASHAPSTTTAPAPMHSGEEHGG